MNLWRPLDAELERWAAAGHQPRLWWRDDDACDVTPELVRLADMATHFRVPLVLAVVPCGGSPEALQRLADFLTPRSGIFAGQHGIAHANRASAGEQQTEFPGDEDPKAIAAAIEEASRKMAILPRGLPLYVPPWNAANPALHKTLPQTGFTLFSAGEEVVSPLPHLRQAHAQLDLLRWKPVPRFRGERSVVSRLCLILRRRRRAGNWTDPVGLLTHHLAHDGPAWDFLKSFLGHTHANPRIAWPAPDEVFVHGEPKSPPHARHWLGLFRRIAQRSALHLMR